MLLSYLTMDSNLQPFITLLINSHKSKCFIVQWKIHILKNNLNYLKYLKIKKNYPAKKN